jgi:hypothetical protein
VVNTSEPWTEHDYHGFRIKTYWSCASAPADRRRERCASSYRQV